MRGFIITSFAAGLAAGAWTAPVDAGTLKERVDAVVDRWTGAEKIVGAVVLIARDGEIVHARAAGFADREAKRPVTRRTIFRLASLTKLAVSATALALAERGALSPEEPVTRLLPAFRPRLADGRAPAITIRQLMTHTSGLGYGFMEGAGGPYGRAGVSDGLDAAGLTLAENVRRLAAAPLLYEPGTQWRYSLSTDVLGAAIEKAAGTSLPRAVERFVTGPLGMRDTRFGVADRARLAAQYLDGAAKARRMKAVDVLPLGSGAPVALARAFDQEAYPSGGSGMTGTADDYLRLLEALRTGGAPILSRRSAAALATHAIGDLRAWTEGDGWGFSLGAAVLLDRAAARTPQNEGTWQWGGALGAHWFVDPRAKLTVVALTNTALAGVIGAFPAELRDAIYAGDGAAKGPR